MKPVFSLALGWGHRHAAPAGAACQTISAGDIKAAGNPLTYIVNHDLKKTANRRHTAKP